MNYVFNYPDLILKQKVGLFCFGIWMSYSSCLSTPPCAKIKKKNEQKSLPRECYSSTS